MDNSHSTRDKKRTIHTELHWTASSISFHSIRSSMLIRRTYVEIENKKFRNLNFITTESRKYFKEQLSYLICEQWKHLHYIYCYCVPLSLLLLYCSIALWRSAKSLRLAQMQGCILIKLSKIFIEVLSLIRPVVLIYTQRAFCSLILLTAKGN